MPSPKKRLPLIAGNWKMHKTLAESRTLAEEIVRGLGGDGDFRVGDLRVGLFPTALSLAEVAGQVRELAGGGADVPSRFLVGAQNMYFESQGAFTGEISGEMIRGVGGNAVILGHSERRHIFGEADDLVGKKVRRALEAELTPILCVGETLEEREADRTQEVVERQLRAGLALLEDAAQLLQVIIAYEPVWAIGTGRTASPDDAQEVHRFIREELRGSLTRRTDSPQGDQGSQEISILYGGSVKPENAGDLLAQPDIDGALVGGASLAADSFLGICRASTAA